MKQNEERPKERLDELKTKREGKGMKPEWETNQMKAEEWETERPNERKWNERKWRETRRETNEIKIKEREKYT